MLPSSASRVTSQSADIRSPERVAPLQEVFSSIQGEGVLVGRRQVFVRFAHCHLKCAYCDTSMMTADGQCHVETLPGSGEVTRHPNPMAPEAVADIISGLQKQAKHHSISLTGGEPLLYHAFLSELLPMIRPQAPIYLETSGTQPEFLEAVLHWTDIVAMDIKLPSTTHEPPQWDNHARFYALATSENPGSQVRTVFVKLVFNADTTEAELDAVKAIVADRHTPIILQPETSLSDRKVHIPPRRMLEIEQALSAHFADVRLIPQTHKMLNVL